MDDKNVSQMQMPSVPLGQNKLTRTFIFTQKCWPHGTLSEITTLRVSGYFNYMLAAINKALHLPIDSSGQASKDDYISIDHKIPSFFFFFFFYSELLYSEIRLFSDMHWSKKILSQFTLYYDNPLPGFQRYV